MNPSNGTCDLCGLPLRHGKVGLVSQDKSFHFCCMGCRQVFQMLLEASNNTDPASFRETELFKKCREIGIIPGSEAELEKRIHSRLPAPSSRPSDGDRNRDQEGLLLHLKVAHMWCPACAWIIEETLKKTPGVIDASCNFSTDRARCRYDPILTSPSQITGAIDSMGYRARPPDEGERGKERQREFIRFGVSAFLTMNVMMLSFGVYSGFFTELSQETVNKLSWPMFIMASVVLFYGGSRIYRKAWSGLSRIAFSMETLITAGSFSAYFYSTYNLLFVGSIHLYYDTASMLITLVLLGKALEARAKRRVQEALEHLFSLRPRKVKICSEAYPDGRYVAAEILERGDSFWIGENDIIAADGLILEGTGSVDESTLTGESVPILKRFGDRLRAGTRVVQGELKARAEGVGDDSTFGQMIQIMERALGSKTPFLKKTDLALQWFVPIILFLAAGTGLVCLFSGLSTGDALVRAVTVMVISCPCALGIAAPLAQVAGISLAGKRGILVRNFTSFEQAEQVKILVFDKTGTMTVGRWEIVSIVPFQPFTEEQALALAASLEEDSYHYIAMKIKERAEERRIKPTNLEKVRTFKNGVTGRMGDKEVKIGSREFLEEEWTFFNPISSGNRPENDPQHSSVYMAVGGRPCALFVFGDEIKESAGKTVKQLLAFGYRVALVSGDGDETTKAVGRKIGIKEAYGRKLPQEKADFILEVKKDGNQVAMVGDGINDAPALVQADLAVSIHSGSSLSNEIADITLMRGDPAQIPDFLDLAKRVNRKICQNLACSSVYNVISIPIAMSGLLTPLIAVCAMLMSSLAVTGNTLMLIKKGE